MQRYTIYNFSEILPALDVLSVSTLLTSFLKSGRHKIKVGLPDAKLENKLIKMKK